ncbi:hypothetical protein HF325_005026 [Metschnikowia pulcherrima]|uniref:Mediator of RNA polymerase II transcription subunit 5 n=1 Tax=Metschnikowia pulcherrima TaxID=27326 RepID=A0A8H7GP99_9ASCO|nr:hypothetical protein HF325_005026 [Metschnikowia pulcherrima]
MPSNHPLALLLRSSLARKINKRGFVSLLEQFLAREHISDSQLGELLLALPERGGIALEKQFKSVEKLQIAYVIEWALSNGKNTAKFFETLPSTSLRCQHKYIFYLKGIAANVARQTLTEDLYASLAQFSLELSDNIQFSPENSTSKRLWYDLIFLWGTLIDQDSAIPLKPRIKEVLTKVSRATRAAGESNMTAYVTRKFISTTDISALNGHEKVIETEHSTAFKASNFSPLNLDNRRLHDLKHAELAKELTNSFLHGFSAAVRLRERPYVVFNWKNFILTDFAHDLKNLAHAFRVDHEWEDAIISSVASCTDTAVLLTKVGGATESYDLDREFLRACVYQGVVSLEKFTDAYPAISALTLAQAITHEIEIMSQVDTIDADFTTKLHNMDPAFTSFEESKLVDYSRNLLSSDLRFLKAKQQRLASVTCDLIDKLIQEKHNEKLSWVALLLLNVPAIANYIFYQGSPWNVLNKFINYIDNETFNVDDDDGNFQDTYTCFGVMLTGVVSLASLFGLNFAEISIQSSYTLDYINEFYFRLSDPLTSNYAGIDEQEKQIIASYDRLFTEWAKALFDVNNDGLTDELLKSVNVKQIYKFVYLLFREAFTARVVGSLNETSLNNGIDYLSQSFLAPCSLEAMQWLISRVGPQQKTSNTMIEILLRILETNTGIASSLNTSEHNYTFRMILNIVGPSIVRKIRSFGNMISENMQKLMNKILQETDAEYCQWNILADEQTKGHVSTDSIKNEITSFLKESEAMMSDSLIEAWARMKHKWDSVSSEAICYTLLEEVEHSAGTRGSVIMEESKLVVDFYLFMLTCSGAPDADDVDSYLVALNSSRKSESLMTKAGSQFALTINDHYSSYENATQLTSLARSKLTGELQHWRSAHGY